MSRYLSNILFWHRLLTGVLIFLSLFSVFSSLQAKAVDSTCEAEVISIKWWDLGNPGKFLPVIPDDCSEGSGGLKPLSLTILPTLAIRLYGFLVSLAFSLIFPVIVIAGIWYIWGGIDESGVEQSKKLLLNALYGWLILAAFYIIVFASLGIFGGVNGLDLQNTKLDTFFI